jgi:hypothetical protein
MGKRTNPHRRLLAKQAQALAAERLVQSATNGAEMAKLQQGRVRSPLDREVQLTTYAVPRPLNWEGKGQRVRKHVAKPNNNQTGHYPRERIKASALASDLRSRKREKETGIKE